MYTPDEKMARPTSTIDNSDCAGQRLPFVLAGHTSKDCYFDIKLTQAESIIFHGRSAYQLHFKLDLARPFNPTKRIRSAVVEIHVTRRPPSTRSQPAGPTIMGIDPEALLVCMADHEVNSGQNVGLNVGTPATAPAAISANASLSWGDKTTFKGNRLIHGFLMAEYQAQWKMYEEPKSRSGLPPSVQLMMIVESAASFYVSARIHVLRWSGWGSFGMVKTISTPAIGNGVRAFFVQSKQAPDPSERALKISDNITTFLNESEEKMKTLEGIVDGLFPRLSSYGRCTALLVLQPLNQHFDRKQFYVLFDRGGLKLGRRSTEVKANNANGIFDVETMSRQHAEVWVDEETDKICIKAIAPRKGTFVNRRQLAKGDVLELHKGDELQLGKDVLGEDQRSILHHKLLAKVEFAGLLSSASPEDALDQSLILGKGMEGEDELDARKKLVRKDIQNKFSIWSSMAVSNEKHNMLEILGYVVNRRLGALGIETLELGPAEGYEGEEYDGYKDRVVDEPNGNKSYVIPNAMRRSEEHSRERSTHQSTYEMFDTSKIFMPKLPTGEEVLASHRSVGRGWKEAKL